MTYIAAFLVIATLAVMASGKVEPIFALLVGLVAAALLGISSVEDLASGLGNPGVITIAGMLVIAKGVVQTGVVSRVTWGLLSSTTTAPQALRRLAVPTGAASALINTTPIVAMLIPAAKQLEQTRRIPAREVLMPIAHITTLCGAVTLIGTGSNLLIAGIAGDSDVKMTMLSFAPVALPVAIIGSIVVLLVGPRLLRGDVEQQKTQQDWRVEIPIVSPALAEGARASALGIFKTQDYQLLEIERWGERVDPDEPIQADDVLVFSATDAGIAAIWGTPLFGLSARKLFEVSISAGEGATLYDFERDGSVRVVAARTDQPLHETDLEPGATCFVSAYYPEAVARIPSVALAQDAARRLRPSQLHPNRHPDPGSSPHRGLRRDVCPDGALSAQGFPPSVSRTEAQPTSSNDHGVPRPRPARPTPNRPARTPRDRDKKSTSASRPASVDGADVAGGADPRRGQATAGGGVPLPGRISVAMYGSRRQAGTGPRDPQPREWHPAPGGNPPIRRA